MYVVGLTGGIASGKSTVSAMLEKKGAGIIDADRIGHEVILKGAAGYDRLVESFGREILGDDNEISRPRLASKVFGDREKVSLLNSITHPLIGEEIFRRMDGFRKERGEGAIVILDAPLLVEAGMIGLVDTVIVVAASPEIQIERLKKDRSMPEDEARKRISSQMDLEEKLAHAGHVIRNEGTVDELEERVEEVWRDITSSSEKKCEESDAKR